MGKGSRGFDEVVEEDRDGDKKYDEASRRDEKKNL